MQSTLFTPRAEAASSSPSSAMRLRSRPVTWSIGSNPMSSMRWAAAIGAIVIFAPAESVRLKASTIPLRAFGVLKQRAKVGALWRIQFGGYDKPAGIQRFGKRWQLCLPTMIA